MSSASHLGQNRSPPPAVRAGPPVGRPPGLTRRLSRRPTLRPVRCRPRATWARIGRHRPLSTNCDHGRQDRVRTRRPGQRSKGYSPGTVRSRFDPSASGEGADESRCTTHRLRTDALTPLASRLRPCSPFRSDSALDAWRRTRPCVAGFGSWRKNATSRVRRPSISLARRAGEPDPVRRRPPREPRREAVVSDHRGRSVQLYLATAAPGRGGHWLTRSWPTRTGWGTPRRLAPLGGRRGAIPRHGGAWARRALVDAVLADQIRMVHTASDGTYGVHQVSAELRD